MILSKTACKMNFASEPLSLLIFWFIHQLAIILKGKGGTRLLYENVFCLIFFLNLHFIFSFLILSVKKILIQMMIVLSCPCSF